MIKKIKSMWSLLCAKHYAVLLADSEEEISWAMESLRKADEIAQLKENI